MWLLPRVVDGEAPVRRFPYAVQRLGHASPVLCPVRALLAYVSLGLRPWLHPLRRRFPAFVHRLRSYYAGVRLLLSVHHRLRLLAFPIRTGVVGSPPGRARDLPGSDVFLSGVMWP